MSCSTGKAAKLLDCFRSYKLTGGPFSLLALQTPCTLRQVHRPQRIAGNLMEDRFLPFPEGLRLGVRPWSAKDRYAFAAKHALDAEDMVAIAHSQAGMHTVDVHDGGDASR